MLKEINIQPNIRKSNDSPFNHFLVADILPLDLCQSLMNWLELTEDWEYTETSFYKQYEFSILHVNLPQILSLLISQTAINSIKDYFLKSMKAENLSLVGITVHKLIDGYKMGVHNDFIGNQESHRLVIQINEGWNEENGGYLMLHSSKNPEDITTLIRPINNSAIGFEISKQSYHSVSTIYNFTRYTLVYTFRSNK